MNRKQLNDRFDKYCEQKDCERICTLENYRDCFIGYLLDNYDLKLKEEPKIDWTKDGLKDDLQNSKMEKYMLFNLEWILGQQELNLR